MQVRPKSPFRTTRPKWQHPKAHTPALPPCLEQLRRGRLLAQLGQSQSPVLHAVQRSSEHPTLEGENHLNDTSSAARKSSVGARASLLDLEPRPLVEPMLPLKEKVQKEVDSLADIIVGLVRASDTEGGIHAGSVGEAAEEQVNHEAANRAMTFSGAAVEHRDGPPQKHPSAAVIIDCLEAVLMKGIEPVSRVTNEKLAFVDRTLAPVVEAASRQLLSTKIRRSELLIEAEELRAALQRKECELEDAKERVAKVFYQPKRHAMKTEIALEAVSEEVESLETNLQSDVCTCEDLRQRVTNELHVAREDWRKEREQLVSDRESRLAALSALNTTLPRAEMDLIALEHEVDELSGKIDAAEIEARLLSGTKDKLEALEIEHDQLNAQVREARAKLDSKTPKGKRKSVFSALAT